MVALGLKGDEVNKYADFVSGGDPITMMVRLTGGKNASVQPCMLIFMNQNRSYPIRGVPDDVPGVCYRSSPKGWMDGATWKEWLGEPRALPKLIMGRKRHLFVDNCSSHSESGAHIGSLLQRSNTSLRKLVANATHLCQAADSFVIQKIKDSWRRLWDKHRLKAIKEGLFNDKENEHASGRLENPGKHFYLKLAAEVIRDVNSQVDSKGINFARKAMVRTGLSLNYNGKWEECQLSDELQKIVAKHRNHFEGEPVHPWDIETESDTEEDD